MQNLALEGLRRLDNFWMFLVSCGCQIARFFAFYNTANMFGGWTIEHESMFIIVHLFHTSHVSTCYVFFSCVFHVSTTAALLTGLFGRWLSYRLQQRHPAAYVGEILSVKRK